MGIDARLFVNVTNFVIVDETGNKYTPATVSRSGMEKRTTSLSLVHTGSPVLPTFSTGCELLVRWNS